MNKFAHESRLQSLKDEAIRSLRLTVRLGVRNGCVIHPSALSGAKVSELLRVKIRTIVCDDTVGNSISEYYLFHEFDGRA
jgi:hypothetical protein